MYVKIWSPRGDKDWEQLNHVFEVDEVRSQYCIFYNFSEYYEFSNKRKQSDHDKHVGYGNINANSERGFQVVDLQMERDGNKFSCLVYGEAEIYIMNERGDTIDRIFVGAGFARNPQPA